MKVAVLLAAFNGSKFIKSQIESILHQLDIDLHIFISVDLCDDDTYLICKSYESKFENITVLSYGCIYGSAKENFFRLIKEVDIERYDYIALSDQDDVWFPGKIIRAVNKLQKDKYRCYSSDVLAMWPNGKTVKIKKSYPQCSWDYYFESAGPGCTYVFDAIFAKNLKYFIIENDLSLLRVGGGQHDWFIYAFARANDYAWFIDDKVWMYYNQHSGNLVGVNHGLKAFVSRLKIIQSGWAFQQSLLLVNILNANDHFIGNCLQSGRFGFVKLMINSYKCRRRLRDKFYFSIACLLMVYKGFKI